MRRGLAAWPAEDVGWQEGRPKPGQGRGSAFELLETSYEGVPSGRTGIRRRNGKSEARGVFRGSPTGCQGGIPRTDCHGPHIHVPLSLFLNQQECVLELEASLSSWFSVHSCLINWHMQPSILCGSHRVIKGHGAEGGSDQTLSVDISIASKEENQTKCVG